ncbi:S10 family peptidase [Rhodohalobacter sp. 614A]|uniref:S10 family peptidase n=1 Tax=Rhodohalobacter sp. 614A TaxID=2908649 RepID=UPI001F1F7A8A|nr:carboxypeptidase [Rhodohalobacter sp. 614A]
MDSVNKTNYIRLLFILFCGLYLSNPLLIQAQELNRELPADTVLVSTDEVTIKGENIPYQVMTGTQPVYGEDGEPDAALYFTYYERTDVDDKANRPIFISFNGGPGAGSLWMHLGYTSPKRLKISDEGYPVQPYGIEDNPHSILDVADIVYVNPVNTGFSRILNDGEGEQFFGVNEDLTYLADWIDNFISRRGRWESPKYLIGESYGTPRVSGLSGMLQSRHWMFLNGVILVSPTGLGLEPAGPAPRSSVLKLPYYTAAAWYHNQLPSELQSRDLTDLLPEVEDFTIDEYLPAVSRGGFIDDAKKQEITGKVAQYAGLSEEFVSNYNNVVPESAFWKELLRDEGFTIGRLDSRYKGIDKAAGGDRYDYPAEYSSWKHSFTPAINHYLRDVLGFETDLQYYVSGPVRPWNRDGNETGEMLRQAMAENPNLKVMVQSGYYDGATDYFSAKYVMWNLDPSGKMKDRFRFEGYRSGHMMYLRTEDLESSNEHIREFIMDSLPEEGAPAQY